MRNFILVIHLFLVSFNAKSQLFEALPRNAYWGASFTLTNTPNSGAAVTAIVPKGFAESTDLRKGDVIAKVNGLAISSRTTYYEVFYSTKHVRGGSSVTLDVIRDGKPMTKTGILPKRPLESYSGIITEYRSIKSPNGYRVQVIVTRPEGKTGKIPGIFFVRWMSCDPIENTVSRKDGIERMLEDFVVKSGYAVMRVEKPGFGDSEGPCCYNADFNHELAAHREAFNVFSAA